MTTLVFLFFFLQQSSQRRWPSPPAPCVAYLGCNRLIRPRVRCPHVGPPPTHRLYSDHKPLRLEINALTEPVPGAAHSNLPRLARSRRTLLPTLIHCKRYRKAMRPARNSSPIVYILRHVTKRRWEEIWRSSPMGLITIQFPVRSASEGQRWLLRRCSTGELPCRPPVCVSVRVSAFVCPGVGLCRADGRPTGCWKSYFSLKKILCCAVFAYRVVHKKRDKMKLPLLVQL